MMSMLTEKAVKVRLSTHGGSIGSSKKDKDISRAVALQHNADREEAGSWNKILIAKRFRTGVSQAINAAKGYHMSRTLPWDDEGWRILTTDMYFEHSSAMEQYQRNIYKEVKNFEDKWDEVLADAELRLGDMFNASEFADRDKLFAIDPKTGQYARFQVVVRHEPIQDVNDFRVGLNAMEIRKLEERHEARLQDILTAAVDDLWGRLRDPIETLKDRLESYEEADRKVFRSAWIQNVSSVVEIIPKLNLTGDERMDKICKDAERQLCKLNADQMKSSQTARKIIKDRASEILKEMACYTGQVTAKEAA